MSFTSEGNRFWLLFPLISDGAGNRLCYGLPLVINRTIGIEVPLTWSEAISWIEEGLPDLSDEHDRRWAKIMIKVAALEGGLPDEVSQFIGDESGSKTKNKTDAGGSSYGICRVIGAHRSLSPDPKRLS